MSVIYKDLVSTGQ